MDSHKKMPELYIRLLKVYYNIVTGSFSDNEPMEQVVSQEELIGRIKTKVINSGNKYEEREFHKKCTKAIEDIVVIAKPEAGKTEAFYGQQTEKKQYYVPNANNGNIQ